MAEKGTARRAAVLCGVSLSVNCFTSVKAHEMVFLMMVSDNDIVSIYQVLLFFGIIVTTKTVPVSSGVIHDTLPQSACG